MQKKDISQYAEEVMENIMAIHRGVMRSKMGFSGMGQMTIPQYASLALIESAGALKMKDIAKQMKISLPAATFQKNFPAASARGRPWSFVHPVPPVPRECCPL